MCKPSLPSAAVVEWDGRVSAWSLSPNASARHHRHSEMNSQLTRHTDQLLAYDSRGV